MPAVFALLKAAWASAWGVLKLIPWQVWVILGVVLTFWLWIIAHDRALVEKVTADRDGYWSAREKQAADAHAAAMNRKREEVADLVLKGIADRDALERRLRDIAALYLADFEKLRKERASYVTALADSRCTVPVGFVLQFNAGAAIANRSRTAFDPAATIPRADLVDAPAGIALSSVAEAVTMTQSALSECRGQVIGWQEFWGTVVVPWYASLTEIVKGTP